MSEETIERLTTDLKRMREDHEKIKKNVEELQEQVKKLKKDEEEENMLKKYIKSEWGTCKQARARIEYPEYYHKCVTVPGVDRTAFLRFVRSNDCFCGECEK